MKKLFLSMVALIVATLGYAQITFVATLQHEGQFTIFYGSSGLQQAYNAAIDGDTITLSGGNFSFSGSFEKGITLRGTGYEADLPTVVSSEMNFRSKNDALTATIEGIQFSKNTHIYNTASDEGQGKITFLKCFFNSSVYAYGESPYSTERGPITRFTNCILREQMYFSSSSYPYFTFANCYVHHPICEREISSNLTAFENCIISYRCNTSGTVSSNYSSSAQSAYYLNFYNSIIVFDANPNYASLPSSATASNCLCTGTSRTECFQNLYNNGSNRYVSDISQVFKSYVAGYTKGDTFELTDNAAATYLGTDGTQIGMQGGHAPYTPIVQYPIITTLKADDHTTKEGILNVEVGIDE